MDRLKKLFVFCTCLFFFSPTILCASDWHKINSIERLRAIYSNSIVKGVDWPGTNFERNRVHTEWQKDYCRNGFGQLKFMGQLVPFTWEVNDESKLCVVTAHGQKCYFIEENSIYENIYRSGLTGSENALWVFKVLDQTPTICEQSLRQLPADNQ